MVHYHLPIFGLLFLQLYVSTAPNNITNVENPITTEDNIEVAKIDNTAEITNTNEPIDINNEEPKLDSQPIQIEESKIGENSTQSFRQKRFYNFYGYGVPPINPVVYPSYNKRDQSAETGVFGVEDPLDQIQRRLQDIASFVRQPVPPPPPPSHFPFFFPVIYIPQYGCDCNTNNGNTEPPPQPENRPQPPKPEQNQTIAEERFPVLDDVRQNWGITSNTSDTEYDEEEFSRPISFDPINPSRPNMRPAPDVNHGSSEGNSVNIPQASTTVRPFPSTRRPAPPQDRPSTGQGRPSSPSGSRQPVAPYPPSVAPTVTRDEQPSACDGAVLSCCHQSQVTYDCFVVQGCPDPTSYGNPCDSLVILQVINKFQKYYGVRNGK